VLEKELKTKEIEDKLAELEEQRESLDHKK